jgi:hypothetical protein
MIFEAREALDDAERIIHNKHPAVATGTQHLSPVFRLLKQIVSKYTAKNKVADGLGNEIVQLFVGTLCKAGSNLDGNPRKKKTLIDFLL